MILKGLKRRSNQIFLKNNLESFSNNTRKKTPKHIHRILLISDNQVQFEALSKSLKKELGSEVIDIHGVVFTNQVNGELDCALDKSNFGWYGKVESTYLKTVLTNTYDLLINHSKVENLYTDLVALQGKAGLKIGLGKLNSEYYDLLIQCESSDLALFTSELKKYLEILK